MKKISIKDGFKYLQLLIFCYLNSKTILYRIFTLFNYQIINEKSHYCKLHLQILKKNKVVTYFFILSENKMTVFSIIDAADKYILIIMIFFEYRF